jgi:uncharacterized protein YndB with AHSA1/START domain
VTDEPAHTFEVSATRRIDAPPERVYAVFADYREAHPKVLPPSFFAGLTVVEGGQGAGTKLIVHAKVGRRTRDLRGVVTEPEPGRLLVETYPDDHTVTSFLVEPEHDGGSRVTISTVLPKRPGPLGWIERLVVRRMMPRVYNEELDLVAAYVSGEGRGPSAA